MNRSAVEDQSKSLAVLANGIIPADGVDDGAASVNAGARLAEKLKSGPFSALYQKGLETASNLSNKRFKCCITQLNPHQVHELISDIANDFPAFFKQVRMDVSALYLSDPNVWQKIGFPGPSIQSGGYSDFDQPQTQKLVQLKEPLKMSTTTLLPSVEAFLAKPGKLLINNNWVDAVSGEMIETFDPATGKVMGKFAAGAKEDVDAAVKAARRAFQGSWRKITPYERGRMLQKAAGLIESHADELAQLITLDNGKPLWEAKKEAATAVSWTEYYAGWSTKILGDQIPLSIPGEYVNYTIREPLGVVAGLTPPNFPLTMPLYKIAPALATGNTFILKPAEQTTMTALRLVEIFLEAGFPEGVLNVITGYGDPAGAALANHDDVDKITFTGSTEVGRLLVKAAAGNLKKVSLELGGKSPNIVFADADMDAALMGVFFGVFFCQGEICSAGSRVLIEQSIFDDFINKITEKVKAVKLGHGLDPETKMGPLVSLDQQQRVLEYLQIGKDEKANAITGGKAPGGELADGYFVEPTVFTGVENHMRIAQEEIFGPVVCAIPFKDYDEAIQIANNSTYGLTAGVWTQDVKKAHQAGADLETGTVWVNCYNAFDNASPWGGMKQSGWGREKGPYGLDLFTHIKSVVIKYR